MRIAILTEAGRGIGNGHLTRTTALADGLQEADCTVHFYIRGNEAIYPFERTFNIRFSDWHQSNFSDSISDLFDIVIIDSYEADILFLNSLNNQPFLAVFLVDATLSCSPTGVVLFPAGYANDYLEKLKKTKHFLGGVEYLLYTRELWNTPRAVIRNEINTIGISLGSVVESWLEPILKCLQQLHVQPVSFHVFGTPETGQHEIDKHFVYHGFLNREEYIARIREADILITNSGQSLNEALLLSIPTLSLICADNQAPNAMFWEKKGCATICDIRNNFNRDQIIKRLKSLINIKKRTELFQKCSSTVDHGGAIRSAKKLLFLKRKCSS